MTRKWIEVNYLSNGQYFVNKNIGFKTPVLRSNLYDYSDAYIVVKGRITNESNQECSQNLKEVPQNFMEVFNVDDATANKVIQKNQHR